jgi:hypothetical protein
MMTNLAARLVVTLGLLAPLGATLACDNPVGVDMPGVPVDPNDPNDPNEPNDPNDPGEVVCDETDRIYVGLKPACVACHSEGTNKPFFASSASFRALLATDPQYVRAGLPDDSELMHLLRGQGTGAFRQMPTAGAPWAELEGQAITLDDVRAWIVDLDLAPRSTLPNPDAPTTRRLRAEEIVATLHDALGLTEADFRGNDGTNHVSPTVVMRGDVPVYAPDRAPGFHYADQRLDAGGRFRALGGPLWLDGAARTRELTPGTLQALQQISHAWCRMAVKKPNNTTFFVGAGPGDRSTTNASGVRATLSALHLRLLGAPASAADLDALINDVMAPAESQNAEDGWVAACAALALDPQFLSW